MRNFILLIAVVTFVSCSQNDTKKKELAFTEKDSITTPDNVDTVKTNINQEATSQILVLAPLKIDGDIGQVTFSQKGKTFFYFDAKSKKGKINLNGMEYILTKMEGSYKLSGNNVNITTTEGKWAEMDSDCSYGKSLEVTIKMGTQILKLNNVEVQDCSSMVE